MSAYSAERIVALAHEKWGISLKRQGKELHGPCPQCNQGHDRFWINSNGHCFCRQCHFDTWLESSKPLDPEVRAKVEAERAREQAEALKRQEVWLAGFRAGVLWKTWHDQMKPPHRAWWHDQGITDSQIDTYELGFTPSLGIGEQAVAAYTIPIRDPHTWEIIYVHYRLNTPLANGSKYYYVPGIPTREFYARQGEFESALVVEGAKKAIVMGAFLGDKVQVVGLPGMTPSKPVMQRIESEFSRVWLALDPGKERDKANWYFREYVPQAKAISLPDKPDNLRLAGMTLDEFKEFVRQAK